MAGVFPNKWAVVEDGEHQEITVEHDCMEPGQPLIVSVEIENLQGDERSYALACLTPTQAREMANALTIYAFFADKENARAKND